MWVDASGNLYVADGGSAAVYEYNVPSASNAPGAPSLVYSDSVGAMGAQIPQSVVVCGQYLYAANIAGGEETHNSFTVWQLGNATPLGMATRTEYENATGGVGSGIACDASGHVDFAWNQSYLGPGAIDEWTQQSGAGAPAYVATFPATPSWVSGIAFRMHDVCMAGSIGNAGPAVTCVNAKSKKPAHTCSTQVSPAFADPYAVAFQKGLKDMWVADAGNQTLYQLDFKTCTTLNTITKGLNGAPFTHLDGVALSPGAIP